MIRAAANGRRDETARHVTARGWRPVDRGVFTVFQVSPATGRKDKNLNHLGTYY